MINSRDKCLAAARAPLSFPSRDDLFPDLRMAVHGRYLVLFRLIVDAGVVRVERIVHAAHDPRVLLR